MKLIRGCAIALGALLAMAWMAAYFKDDRGLLPQVWAQTVDDEARYLIFGDRKCKDLVASATQIETVIRSSWPYFVDQESSIFGYSGPPEYETGHTWEDCMGGSCQCLDLEAMRADLDRESTLVMMFWHFISSPLRGTDYFEKLQEAIETTQNMKEMISTTSTWSGSFSYDDSHGQSVLDALDRAVNSPCGRISIQIHSLNATIANLTVPTTTGDVPNQALLEAFQLKEQAQEDYAQCFRDWEDFRSKVRD